MGITVTITKEDIHRMIEWCAGKPTLCNRLRCLVTLLQGIVAIATAQIEEECLEEPVVHAEENSPWGE